MFIEVEETGSMNTEIDGHEIDLDYAQLKALEKLGWRFVELEEVERYPTNIGVEADFEEDDCVMLKFAQSIVEHSQPGDKIDVNMAIAGYYDDAWSKDVKFVLGTLKV